MTVRIVLAMTFLLINLAPLKRSCKRFMQSLYERKRPFWSGRLRRWRSAEAPVVLSETSNPIWSMLLFLTFAYFSFIFFFSIACYDWWWCTVFATSGTSKCRCKIDMLQSQSFGSHLFRRILMPRSLLKEIRKFKMSSRTSRSLSQYEDLHRVEEKIFGTNSSSSSSSFNICRCSRR